jgi:hypothetical protein
MTTDPHLSRESLAIRWNTSTRTIDRLRKTGRLRWIDLAAGRGARPIVRFRLVDVEIFEREQIRDAPERSG